MADIALLMQSLEYIENHLGEELKTLTIATACCCSKSTLEKMFRYVYHLSLHDYIVRRRMMAAAKRLAEQPETSVLEIAVAYGYQSHEAFARAFKKVWNCNPSEVRKRTYWELFPRLLAPMEEGDMYMIGRRPVDISRLYDLFRERKQCYFVCCDIKSLVPINEISHKAGDLAILTTMERMQEAAGEEDIVFRIGGDEFCILTNSEQEEYAHALAERIRCRNGESISYEGQEIPLHLYVAVTKPDGIQVKYDVLFEELHRALQEAKE